MSILQGYTDFEVHYALALASALFSDYLRREPSASADEKSEFFRRCVEGGLSEAKHFSALAQEQ